MIVEAGLCAREPARSLLARPQPPSERDAMTTAFEALCQGLFDYSGLFPPAKLSMPEAVANYRAYRAGERAWMLGRFCCPSARLDEMRLAVQGDWGEIAQPWRVASISAPSADADGFFDNLSFDLDNAKLFESRTGGRAMVDSIEARAPLLVAYPSTSRPDLREREVAEFLEMAAERVREAAPKRLIEIFIEFPFTEGWRESLRLFAKAMGATNQREVIEGVRRFALKIRCGGATAKDIPEPKQVAAMILDCRDAGCPFKATAGLHHPTRHFAGEFQAKRHGFFNLFLGAALAQARVLEAPELLEVLFDEKPDSFRFIGDRVEWKKLEVSAQEIRQARETLATGIGSCSFCEPIEDLEKLGLLSATGSGSSVGAK
jgi:hypothetical protein